MIERLSRKNIRVPSFRSRFQSGGDGFLSQSHSSSLCSQTPVKVFAIRPVTSQRASCGPHCGNGHRDDVGEPVWRGLDFWAREEIFILQTLASAATMRMGSQLLNDMYPNVRHS